MDALEESPALIFGIEFLACDQRFKFLNCNFHSYLLFFYQLTRVKFITKFFIGMNIFIACDSKS